VDSGLQIRNVSARSAALRKESRYRDALLDHLRTDAHRSSTLIRDYLVEHEDIPAANERIELLQLRSRVEQELRDYERGAPENEKKAILDLQQRAAAYWSSLAPALDWDRVAKRERGEAFLRNTVIPNRDGLVQFARRVTAIDERLLDTADEQIQLVQAAFQHRVTSDLHAGSDHGRCACDCRCSPRQAPGGPRPTSDTARRWRQEKISGGFQTALSQSRKKNGAVCHVNCTMIWAR